MFCTYSELTKDMSYDKKSKKGKKIQYSGGQNKGLPGYLHSNDVLYYQQNNE